MPREQNGWLREDIAIDHAIDAVWALNSAQIRWLLLDHGWSHERYARWLAELIHHAIFADDTHDMGGARRSPPDQGR